MDLFMRIYKWRQEIMANKSLSEVRKFIYKKKVLKKILDYILVSIGTFLLAFGSVIFLTKCELVAGGVSGIAIIIQHFVDINIYDYVVAGLMVVFWIIGLIFIGKDFALKTLYSSALYIGFTFLLNRVEFFNSLATTFAGLDKTTEPAVGNYILCALFGGVFVGGGIAITFLGGGSSGGVDCIQLIAAKRIRIRESVSGFIIDGLIIVIGMIAMRLWIPALCGILSSFMTAVLIDVVYSKQQNSYQADIISEHWEEINQFVKDKLDRGSTIIHAEGGYKGESRIILRIVFDKKQYDELWEFIHQIDPHAFVTFTQTNAVYGEGFIEQKSKDKKQKKK